jgi:hypothetical protein
MQHYIKVAIQQFGILGSGFIISILHLLSGSLDFPTYLISEILRSKGAPLRVYVNDVTFFNIYVTLILLEITTFKV